MSSSSTVKDAPKVDKWESEDEFEARLNRIQSKVKSGELITSDPSGTVDREDVAKLKAEVNTQKQLLEQARLRIKQLESEAVKVMKRDEDNERMLEEKSEQIRELEEKLAVFESKQSTGISEEELITLHQELERERVTLEEDRQSMENQFRQLELSMARERAEIARERNELSRTKNDLKHKLEALEKNSQKDISPMKKMREELMGEPVAALLANQPGRPATNLPTMPALPALNRKAPEGEDTPKRSGILSRFLGKKDE
ncbi:MAG: hypothetical protein U0796_10955 [Gemmatales bacterium]